VQSATSFADQDEFKRLYERYEQDSSIIKKTLKARELFASFMQERANTGRIYVQNVDHCNTHGAFDPSLAPIRQSNLCMEITLPTKPLYSVQDPEGEVALCTLSAVNLGALESIDELEEIMLTSLCLYSFTPCANINCIVFGLIRSLIETTIYRT
jgi:ribonucleoside-diphosphate reductase alpha chain